MKTSDIPALVLAISILIIAPIEVYRHEYDKRVLMILGILWGLSINLVVFVLMGIL